MYKRILSFIFPDRCTFCGRVLSFCADEICICDACRKRLTLLSENNTCKRCGRPVPTGITLCETCQTHRHHFDRALSCLMYTGIARDAILAFKFGNRRDHCRTFSSLMHRRLLPLLSVHSFDFAVCAPLSAKSLHERGYNQAALLGGKIAKKAKIAFYPKAFSKVRETPKQSTLHYVERLENVRHVYKLTIPAETFRNKHILLVDDVLTTGATADELSRLLKRAGAKSVTVITVASPERNRLEKLQQPDLDEDIF